MTISRSPAYRSRIRARNPAYSSVAAGAWIEQGPAMTASRGAAPGRVAGTARRPARVVAADAADTGSTVATASGVTTTLRPSIRVLTSPSRSTGPASP